MRFVTVHGDAFGLLRGSSLALGPGLNVVHGTNEAGKSTWLDALVVGLVGIRRGPGRRAAEAEFLARRRPWDDLEGDFGVRVVVELGDGRRVELGRDLAANLGTATDLTTGRPVEVPVFDGAHDGSRWLGLDRVTFPLVAAVRQTEVLAVRDDPDRMRDLLQRAATMSGDGVTAREALDTIETALREQVGVRRVNAVRPLQRAVEARARAEADLADARRRHDEQRELVAAASAAGGELRGLERLAAVISTAIERLAAAATVERHERAARLVTELDTLPTVPDTVAEAARRSVEVLARVDARPARPSAPPRRAAEIAAELDALPTLDDHDEQPHPSVVTAALLAEQAAAALAGHETVPPARPAAAPEQIEQWRAWLDEVAVAGRAGPGPARPRRWRPLLGVAAALAGAGVLALAAGWSAPGLALMAAAAVVAVAGAVSRRGTSTTAGRARGSAPEAGAARIGLVAAGFDPDDVGAGYDRLSRLALDAERFAEWRGELVGLRRDASGCDEQLRVALAARPACDGTVGYDRYRQRCDAAASTNPVARRRPALERELGAALEAELGRRRHDEATAALTDDVGAVLAALGELADLGVVGDLGSLTERLRGAAAPVLVAVEARPRRARLEAELSSLLDGRTLSELSADAAAAREVLAVPGPGDLGSGDPVAEALAAAGGSRLPTGDSGPGGRAELLRRRDAVAARRDECASLLAGHEGRLSAMPDPRLAEAEASLEAARREVERVEAFEATLLRARHHLRAAEQVAYRFIAPPLAARLSAWLPEVTDGRYTEALVDPETLDVTVRQSSGRLRPAGRLSHGTAEQVYLLLRLAMCELLTEPGEVCPVLLDEVTVHADEVRAAAMLAVIQRVAADRQVVVFTQERRVAEWGRRAQLAGWARFVELGPAGAVSSAA